MENRLFFLDFTRAIAILLIILFHYTSWLQKIVTGAEGRFVAFDLAGAIGVSLFVILSGASLQTSTQRNFAVSEFYRKRIVAIFPLFYVCYLAVLLVCAVLYGKVPFAGGKPAAFVLTIIGLDGFLAYAGKNYYLIGEWFLGFIIILYAVYPVIRYVFVKNRELTVIGAALLSSVAYLTYDFSMAVFRFPPIRLFEFVLGMYLLAHARFLLDMGWRRQLIVVAALAVLLAVLVRYWGGALPVRYIGLGIVTFLLLAVSSSAMTHPFVVGFFQFVSRYSYGAFLLHHVFLIRFIVANKENLTSGRAAVLYFLIALVCIFAAAWGLTRFTQRLLGHTPGGVRREA